MTNLPTRWLVLTLFGATLAAVAFAVTSPAVAVAQSPGYITQWGTLGSGNGQFNFPAGVATDAAGNVYVADSGNNRIQKFTSDGTYLDQWGSSGAGVGQFNAPMGIAIDATGNVYVADGGNHRIQKFTSDGAYLTQWGLFEPYARPVSVAADDAGNIYVVDGAEFHVEKFTSDGTYLTKWGSRCCSYPHDRSYPGEFFFPWGIAVDAAGIVYVSDADRSHVQTFTSDGTYLAQWPSRCFHPYGVAVDAAGNVYVADDCHIDEFTSNGAYLTSWGSSGSGPGQFNNSLGVAVDAAGNVYASDPYKARIAKFGFLPTPTKPISWGGLKRLYR